ncbi:MAG: hypothetical protein GF330_06095 [Candidatus Eisenbacteria bacterium]|nr:hypothetical protein [Candidatus Eisenbacteria bacterium]
MIRFSRDADVLTVLRLHVPRAPGVYLLCGERGEILYVGMSADLRQRLSNHLGQDLHTDHPRHARLIHAVRGVDYRTIDSELLALLLEDELIKRNRPPFNVRQNEFLEQQLLELTSETYPRLRMIDAGIEPDGRRFGPFRDRYLASGLLRLIHERVGLRSCRDRHPSARCLAYDLGHCCGPCRGRATPKAYGQRVRRAAAFLEGDVSDVVEELRRSMERAGKRLAFERAEQRKTQIAFCQRFGDQRRFLRAFREQRLVIEEDGPPPRVHVFVRGSRVDGETDGSPATRPAPGCSRTARDGAVDPRFLLDRAMLIRSWLQRNAQTSRHWFSDR